MRSRLVATAIALSIAPLLVLPSPANACPQPPSPIHDLDIPRFYGDAAGSRIDPDQKARHDAAVAPLKTFLQTVSRDADRALRARRSADREAPARCALKWLTAWARGQAWLGRMTSKQSEYQRKWDLTGVALAYLKVKPNATADQRRIIEPWLDRLAVASRAFFNASGVKRNNHWYWLGLGLAGSALATGNELHWSQARRITADAARDIRADGALPMELARGRRAIHYHAFAVMPLVVMAELASARGEDWYGMNGGALHRLVALTIAGYRDPAVFERLTATLQHHTRHSSGTGWLPLYARRFPDRVPAVLPPDLWPMKTAHRWTGGDVMALPGIVAASR